MTTDDDVDNTTGLGHKESAIWGFSAEAAVAFIAHRANLSFSDVAGRLLVAYMQGRDTEVRRTFEAVVEECEPQARAQLEDNLHMGKPTEA